jgi:organic radical activating enzyme
VPRFITHALKGEPLHVHDDGSQTRDWLHVRDHARAMDAIVCADPKAVVGEVINIGTGQELSIRDIATVVAREVGSGSEVRFNDYQRPGQVTRQVSTTDTVKRLVGWNATTPFEEGIRETVRWYAANEQWWSRLTSPANAVDQPRMSPPRCGGAWRRALKSASLESVPCRRSSRRRNCPKRSSSTSPRSAICGATTVSIKRSRWRVRRPEHKEELFLPPATMEAVADELATWSTPAVIRIAADGEPLIHPQALPMIRHIKTRGLTVSITTNGILLTERLIRDLLDSRIDVIDISIDAATADTFAKVRPSRGTVNFYPVVERNVLALIAARNERRAATKVMVTSSTSRTLTKTCRSSSISGRNGAQTRC